MALQFRYLLNDANASVMEDSSGNEFHGSYVGNWSFRNRYGRTGQSFTEQNLTTVQCPKRLTGDSYGLTPYNPNGLSAFTACGWVNFGWSGTTYLMLLASNYVNGSRIRLQVNAADKKAYFAAMINGVEKIVSVTMPFSTSSAYLPTQWHFIIGRYDNATSTFRLDIIGDGARFFSDVTNGSKTVSTTANGNVTDNHTLKIGTHTPGTSSLSEGYLQDIRFYDTYLSDTQLWDIYVKAGPRKHLKFDETSGTSIVNSAGETANYINQNSTTINQPGIIGKSYLFDGIDDFFYIDAYNSFSGWVHAYNVTISMWFKTSSLSLNNFYDLSYAAGGNIFSLMRIYLLSGKIQTYWHDKSITSNNISLTTDETYNDNIWHNIVWSRTFDGSLHTHKLYVDSQLKKNGTLINSTPDAGAGNAITFHPNGLAYFDDIKLFPTALSVQNIQKLYEEGYGPLLCWNYRANYKNSSRQFIANGGGRFPKELKVPSSVDISTGMMIDEGKIIANNQFKIIQ